MKRPATIDGRAVIASTTVRTNRENAPGISFKKMAVVSPSGIVTMSAIEIWMSVPVIASGGLSGLSDIEALCAVEGEGVEGVICGRSIYTGALDFAAGQARADALNGF